jgi:hypothetical protein
VEQGEDGMTNLVIDYVSEAFPAGRGISSSGSLVVTWDDVLGAAVTLGRPNLHYVFRHGLASRYEAIFRFSLVRMALEQRGPAGRRLRRTGAFKSLDPTEKGAINYFLGMTFCKLFADKLLGTPWLLHLDVFRAQLNSKILTGRSRPDLVGQETIGGAWHAFECKGRASTPGAKEKTKAKAQAQRLVSVNGQSCSLHIGAITYFAGDVLRFYWRDPEPEEPRKLSPIELKVPAGAWRDYYEPFADLIRPHAEQLLNMDDGPRTVQIEEADIEVGVAPELLPLLLDRRWQDTRQILGSLAPALQERGYRTDGLLVKTGQSWRRPFEERVGG